MLAVLGQPAAQFAERTGAGEQQRVPVGEADDVAVPPESGIDRTARAALSGWMWIEASRTAAPLAVRPPAPERLMFGSSSAHADAAKPARSAAGAVAIPGGGGQARSQSRMRGRRRGGR